MTVDLSDFAWAVRPTESDLELTAGGGITASSGWTAGVGGWAAWAQTAALAVLTDEYTIVVVVDPNQAQSGWRALLSVPAYASGAHADPYHVLLLGAAGLGDLSRLAYHHTVANVGTQAFSTTGAISTATDATSCYALRREGTDIDFIVDGSVHSSTTVAAGSLDFSPSGDVCVGTRSASDPGEGCAGLYQFVGIANRALTDGEIGEIISNPLGFEGTTVTGVLAVELGVDVAFTGREVITGVVDVALGVDVEFAYEPPPITGVLAVELGVDARWQGVRRGKARSAPSSRRLRRRYYDPNRNPVTGP